MRARYEFRPIDIKPIDEKLSPSAGLSAWLEIFDQSPLRQKFIDALPVQKSPNQSGSYPLALMQMASFLTGHDCLDDLESFRVDPVVEKMFGSPTVAPRTMGDYLRSFSQEHNESLRQFLAEMGHFIQHLKKKNKNKRKYFKGDSAYCWSDCILRLMFMGLHYTVSAHDGRTDWKSFVDKIDNWKTWEFTEAEIEWAKENEKALPKIEVGSFLWAPSWQPNIRIRIVVKRTWIEAKSEWKLHGILTNIFDETPQWIVEHHNGRGNAENFIREAKYGYDLLHFPCQKMLANEAYLLLAMVAHNLLRWASLLMDPQSPKFSKKFRRQFLFAPAKLVRHSKRTMLKVSRPFYQEVTRLKQAWWSSLNPTPATAYG